jgi:hypothetical protein
MSLKQTRGRAVPSHLYPKQPGSRCKDCSKSDGGKRACDLGYKEREIKHVAVKEVLLPFNKLAGVDTMLGPEMKSTGEVMGIDYDFGLAFYKACISADNELPRSRAISSFP